MKRLLRMILIFTVVSSFFLLSFSVSAYPDNAVKEFYQNDAAGSGYKIAYTLFLPENYDAGKTYPLLLILHGAGERGDDNELQMKNAVQNLYDTRPELLNGSYVLCPQCPLDEQWVDYPWANGNYSTDEVPESRSMQTAIALLRDVIRNYSVDWNRVYVFGMSMGGYGTWDALVRHEALFAAGVPLCGGGDPSKAELLKEIPIWAYHGTADGAVQFAGTKEMVDTILGAGGERITFTPVEGGSHNMWDPASLNGDLIDWLYAQKLTLRHDAPEEGLLPEPEPDTEAVTEPVPEGETPAAPSAAVSVPVIVGIIAAVLVIAAAVTVTAMKKKK